MDLCDGTFRIKPLFVPLKHGNHEHCEKEGFFKIKDINKTDCLKAALAMML